MITVAPAESPVKKISRVAESSDAEKELKDSFNREFEKSRFNRLDN